MSDEPSERALEAAAKAESAAYARHEPRPWRSAITAIHDPSLGLDRSVCLADVIKLIRSYPDGYNWTEWLADKLEKEFTRDAPR